MNVAIISYDKKFLDSLPKTDEIKIYDDTLSLMKDYQDDIKTIIYDSSSGIFAEDDLKYLIDKLANASIKYFVLTVPENPINKSLFGDNVIFTPKLKFFDLLPDILRDAQQDKNQQEEIDEHIAKDDVNQSMDDLSIFGSDIISTEEEPISNRECILDKLHTQSIPEIEYGDIHIDSKSSLDNIKGELENFKEDIWHIEENQPTVISIDDSLLQSAYPDFIESNEFYFEERDETKEFQNYVDKEEKMEERPMTIEEPIQEMKNSSVAEPENKITVANFNVSISSEDIKKLAMEMAKDMLKNDNALQTIIDHLQIDFQDEAMKEMEEIKNQLRETVRQEADAMIKQEIEKLIKDELKDYVETITAKIVRERLDAIFKTNE